MKDKFLLEFEDLFTVSNLYKAHQKAKKWKNIKIIWEFEDDLFQNLFFIKDLIYKNTFEFWPYKFFEVFDSKKRLIVSSPHKDRIIHWVLYEYLYKIFEKSFIFDTFWNIKKRWASLWLKRAINFFRKKENKYILKIDFSKYFYSVYHSVLTRELSKKIQNPYILGLLIKLIFSFKSPDVYDNLFKSQDTYLKTKNKWMPIGNLTSQLFANIYLNPLDHFVKDYLWVKYYLRYVDDIVVFCEDKQRGQFYLKEIIDFSKNRLKLTLNPKKISIFPKNKWLNFLWYRINNYSVLPRKTTQRKIRRALLINDKLRLISYNWVLKNTDSILLKTLSI